MKQGKPIARSPMKRSTKPMKAASKPMARGVGIKRAAKSTKAPAARSTLKSKGPRMTPIRKAARGQECTLQLPGICNRDPDTTVLCHSNYLADGKGMGLKAPDTSGAFGCAACHDVLDGRRQRPAGYSLLDIEGAFYVAVRRTHAILVTMGLM